MTAFRRLILSGVTVVAVVIWSAGVVAAGGSDWHLGYYTPSGNTLSFASADRTSDGLATFNFTGQDNTALLVQTQGSSALLGDDRFEQPPQSQRRVYAEGGERQR